MPEMISVKNTGAGAIWALSSTAAVAFGWRGGLALIWVLAMILDYATGTVAAIKKGDWNSHKAREGLFHKGGMIAVICAAVLLDLLLRIVQQTGIVSFPFVYNAVLMPVVMAGYAVTEIGSSIENAAAFGAPIHPWLLHAIELAREAVDAAGAKETGPTVDEPPKDGVE